MAEPRTVEIGGGEVLRIRHAIKSGQPALKLEVLTRLTSHSDAMSVSGRPMVITFAALSGVIEAADHARREHMEGAADA